MCDKCLIAVIIIAAWKVFETIGLCLDSFEKNKEIEEIKERLRKLERLSREMNKKEGKEKNETNKTL